MALDTDIKNPDSHLIKRFYSREVKNNFKSAEKAAETGDEHACVYDLVDYIKIDIPGNINLAIDTPAREEHKKRFYREWAEYKANGGAQGYVSGTPIEQWPRVGVNPDMVQELRQLRFSTVQAVAGASDSQIQSIGMIAGQNAFAFRDDARRFLATREAESKLSDADKKQSEAERKLAEANEKIAAQAAQHAADMAEMKEQMRQLLAMAGEKSKPGRPRKEADHE
jgi:hypothetical protein